MGSDDRPAWWYEPNEWGWKGNVDHLQSRSLDFVHQTLSGDRGLEVVEASNERFKNAPGWGQLDEWLGERLEIANAKEYRDRSKYWVTRPTGKGYQPMSKIETTYGMTWGEYSREDIEGKSAQEILANLKFRLPEEKTLQKPVHRYFDSNGKGVAIEFRAVSKDPKTPAWLRDDGLNQMIIGIIDVVRKYPELYDKPIVSCYADERTIPLYEHWMKMKIQSETSAEPLFIHYKDGTIDRRIQWRYIEVSPRDLETVLIERTSGKRTFRDLNQPYPFKLPDGREAMAAPRSQIAFDSNDNVTQATLQRPTELERGIVAKRGAEALWVDRHLVRVSAIQRPYTFELDHTKVVAPAGATLEWNHPFLIERHHLRLAEGKRDPDRFYRPSFAFGSGEPDFFSDIHGDFLDKDASKKARLEVGNPKDFTRRFLEARGALIDPKLARIAASRDRPILLPELGIQATYLSWGHDIIWDQDNLSVRLARDFVTEDGLKAAEGTDLVLTRKGGKWAWERIALGDDYVLNGISFKKGMVLERSKKFGIAAYSNDARHPVEYYPIGVGK